MCAGATIKRFLSTAMVFLVQNQNIGGSMRFGQAFVIRTAAGPILCTALLWTWDGKNTWQSCIHACCCLVWLCMQMGGSVTNRFAVRDTYMRFLRIQGGPRPSYSKSGKGARSFMLSS